MSSSMRSTGSKSTKLRTRQRPTGFGRSQAIPGCCGDDILTRAYGNTEVIHLDEKRPNRSSGPGELGIRGPCRERPRIHRLRVSYSVRCPHSCQLMKNRLLVHRRTQSVSNNWRHEEFHLLRECCDTAGVRQLSG